MRRLVCLGAAAAVVSWISLSGCGRCGAVCENSISITASYQPAAFVDGGADPIFGATVSVCRATECSTGTMMAVSGATAAGGANLTGAFPGSAMLNNGVLGAGVTPGFGFSAHDGDTWSLKVVAANGTTLIDGAKPATYSASVGCDNRPCVTASIQLP